ncbi:MAG: hypothetical protein K8R69_08745 [Deltaproteobacteria bacterium]|nr:hypothetical protein [Deltaproteobacteria bacterium]
MKKTDIDRFFSAAAKEISHPIQIYLTGGTLAWFFGGSRPTQDIDFALKTQGPWEETSRILKELSLREGMPIEFSEDISRWGMVGYADFTRGARLYQSFGKIKVYLLDPIVWSVGKIGRFTSSDLDDLILVFKRQRPDWRKAVRLWASALRQSPRSSEQGLFVKKIHFLLSEHGREIWGRAFNPEMAQTYLLEKIKTQTAKRAVSSRNL